FVLTNIPINVFMIKWMIFGSKSWNDFGMILGVLIGQSLAAGCSFSLFAYYGETFHRPKKVIVILLTMLGGREWLWYRMKFDDLYGRLTYGKKIACAVGSLKNITYFSALEV